jgi:hypothetical protein
MKELMVIKFITYYNCVYYRDKNKKKQPILYLFVKLTLLSET